MRRLRTSLAIAVLNSFLITLAVAQQTATATVPNLIRYAGSLKDTSSAATPTSTVGITFSIYKEQDAGAPLWMETQNVTADASGNYSVLLGSTTATGLPPDLFSQQEQRWLGVQVEGQAEQPRVLLVSVPYALRAHEAETLGGKSISDFVLAKGANSALSSNGAAQVTGSTAINLAATQPLSRKGAASQGPTNFTGSTVDQVVGVMQTGSGIGLSATASSRGIVGTSTGSGTSYGVEGVATGVGGFGVLGTANASTGAAIGVKGSSASPSGTGVRGIETATTGNTTGVSAYVDSTAGTAGVFNNAAGGRILLGQSNSATAFSVDGSGNVNTVAGSYQVGGSPVLSTASANDHNLFLGVGAGFKDIAGIGVLNTLAGYQAGYNNTQGQGNAFFGVMAGYSNTTGSFNTFYGDQAGLHSTTAIGNTFVGVQAGYSNTTGEENVFAGYQAGADNTTGAHNVFFGYQTGAENTTGFYNDFFGFGAGASNTTGDDNTFAGSQSGGASTTGVGNTFYGSYAGASNTSGSNNSFLGFFGGENNTTGDNDIYVGSLGPSSGTESNTIRLGGDNGTGYGPQTTVYIAGIYGSTSTSGVPVYITSDGHLGTQTSSLRFKEQVRDMGDSTSSLMKLRPVTFVYKTPYDDGSHQLQFGLIAEEVAKVYPDLVAYGSDGKPYTVRYQYLSTMLLNEIQKQYHRAEAEAKVIEKQQDEIQSLQKQNGEFQQRLSRLESLVRSSEKIARQDPAEVVVAGKTQ